MLAIVLPVSCIYINFLGGARQPSVFVLVFGKQLVDFTFFFPAFCRLRRADSVYVYHYTLTFEPDFAGAA